MSEPYKTYALSYLDTVTEEEEKRDLGATFRVSFDCGVRFGELYKSPVTSPHGPIELKNGSILWVGRTFSKNNSMMSDDCVCAYCVHPETGNMEYLGSIEDIVYEGEKLLSCEPHAIELEDGTVLCHIRAQRPATATKKNVFTTYQSVSADGGRSWSKPEPLLSERGGAPAHLIKHSSGVLISVYGYRSVPYGIRVMLSRDNGKTWDTDHELYRNEVSYDLGYPSTVELSDGSLLTVFYARPEKNSPAVILQQKWRLEG